MKLVEIYSSIQGEGPNTGKPVQFVRFGGCNYRCPGWPCDTQFAIDPQYRDQWVSYKPYEVFDMVADWPRHVVLTGGEPLIQPAREIDMLAQELLARGYSIDLFTNGSRPFQPWCFNSEVTIVMDWKLKGSGESEKDLEQRRANAMVLKCHDALKFVCKDWDDLFQAEEIYLQAVANDWWMPRQLRPRVYVGAVFGVLKESDVADFIVKRELDWYLNVQMHQYIWTANERRR